jgi:hypothetical protein
MAPTAREVRDRQAIHELRARYARAIDFEEYGRADEVFTDDAEVEYRVGTLHGAGAVEEYWREEVDYEFSMHTVQMPEIDVDGDEATGEWYMLVFYVAPDGAAGHVMGSYSDEYCRTDDGWRIARMGMEIDHDTGGYHD